MIFTFDSYKAALSELQTGRWVRQHLWHTLSVEQFLLHEDLPVFQKQYSKQKGTLLASPQVYLYGNEQNKDFITGT